MFGLFLPPVNHEDWICKEEWFLYGAYDDIAKAAQALGHAQGKETQTRDDFRHETRAQYCPTPPRIKTWYGLVSQQGTKALVTGKEQLAVCRAAGFVCKAVFESEQEAKAWGAVPTPHKTVQVRSFNNGVKRVPYTDVSTARD